VVERGVNALKVKGANAPFFSTQEEVN
jgi:hypothetical protein